MLPDNKYDIAIAGGGLAGLATAILLTRKGHTVIVFEKETYPFHKVCGEYISNESKVFLNKLGIDPTALGASNINKVLISSIKGRSIKHPLHLGGFAVSRYRLDHEMAKVATREGVTVKENVRVNDIRFNADQFEISTSAETYQAKIACACYGKKSNMDVKWKRQFTLMKKTRLNNFVGVKYHIKTDFPFDTIALHNFRNGYGGIVKIEEDKYCLCYLTTAGNLQRSGGIKEMEEKVLSENPYLQNIFSNSEMLYDSPLTISQISFDKKTKVEDHVLMIGDAAGMITSLCGNGMSMALHGAKIAADHIDQFLLGKTSREEMETSYQKEWRKNFATRLWFGRTIQKMFDSRLFGVLIPVFKAFPFVVKFLIRQTHGKTF